MRDSLMFGAALAAAALDAITFVFLDRFPNAEEMEFQLVTAHGQSSFEVQRGEPPLGLGGLI
jgi:hypothetical protein